MKSGPAAQTARTCALLRMGRRRFLGSGAAGGGDG
jgi:hypothetical protein